MVTWVPLESNPEVMNKFLYQLGVPEDWGMFDIYGFGAEELAMVPKPVISVIMLFPFNDAYENRRLEEESFIEKKGQNVSENIYYLKQYIHNACGTIALIHSVANNRDKIQLKDGILKQFLDNGKDMSPSSRGELLLKAEDFSNAHKESAFDGQTAAPDPADAVPYHFVSFVCKDGYLYELDGRKFEPINHGPSTPKTLLEDTVNVVQEKFVAPESGNIHFTLLALSNCSED
ncbi:ubiquitin carboxyl-terminal hydrolase isozyme L3 isoform X2 [Daktulosphaira vitifoliae]|uniref:ubiquitin carboxyl-terminal hydrolase isozyme L3 isoform X2 n=1 Tax=Daktulosphaira vitifoliae TaxID=58002 RepID=UPI0021A99D36|nr:ubiquitin carboxyl-terminal hydrolase isozyme L3 isoform X2 [Daktulosphaira vitifoliae]